MYVPSANKVFWQKLIFVSDNIYFGVATFTPYSFLRSSTNPVVVIPMVAWQPPMQTLSGWSRPAVIYWWRRMIAWRDKPPWFLTYHFPLYLTEICICYWSREVIGKFFSWVREFHFESKKSWKSEIFFRLSSRGKMVALSDKNWSQIYDKFVTSM